LKLGRENSKSPSIVKTSAKPDTDNNLEKLITNMTRKLEIIAKINFSVLPTPHGIDLKNLFFGISNSQGKGVEFVRSNCPRIFARIFGI